MKIPATTSGRDPPVWAFSVTASIAVTETAQAEMHGLSNVRHQPEDRISGPPWRHEPRPFYRCKQNLRVALPAQNLVQTSPDRRHRQDLARHFHHSSLIRTARYRPMMNLAKRPDCPETMTRSGNQHRTDEIASSDPVSSFPTTPTDHPDRRPRARAPVAAHTAQNSRPQRMLRGK